METTPEWVDRTEWPFTDRWVETPQGRLHYVDEGSGPTVLFVHGTPTWAFEWRHLISGLRSRFRCVAPDLLGFGLSERPTAFPYTPEAHAEVIAAFVERVGLRDVVLVVHDFGGPIALPLALQGRARAVVVLNSWMWPFDDFPDVQKGARMVEGGLGRFLYRHLNLSLKTILPKAYGDRGKLTKEIHRQYLMPFRDADGRERVLWTLARSLNGSAAHYRSMWERRAALASVPTLVVWGMADPAFRPTHLERWIEALPHAKVVRLDGVGHWPHEEAPERVLEALREFLVASTGELQVAPR